MMVIKTIRLLCPVSQLLSQIILMRSWSVAFIFPVLVSMYKLITIVQDHRREDKHLNMKLKLDDLFLPLFSKQKLYPRAGSRTIPMGSPAPSGLPVEVMRVFL